MMSLHSTIAAFHFRSDTIKKRVRRCKAIEAKTGRAGDVQWKRNGAWKMLALITPLLYREKGWSRDVSTICKHNQNM